LKLEKTKNRGFNSTEAEYIVSTEASKEAIFIHDFLNELGIIPERKITILCDNIETNKLGRNLVYQA